MPRTLWLVRHGQRIDNVDESWKHNAPRGAWDDPHLTDRGLKQAEEVGKRLANEKIDYVFCSPFLRCVQTISQILKQLKESKPKIFIEHGFCESLSDCQSPPGFLQTNKLKEQFNLIDDSYKVFLDKLSKEANSLDCLERIQMTLEHVLNNHKGNILIVSHGSPIAACHKVLSGEFKYTGQCTISKYQLETIQSTIDENGNFESSEDNGEDEENANEDEENANKNLPLDSQTSTSLTKKFKIKRILAGDSNHLSDRTNLRDVPKFIQKAGNLIALC
uniref:Phosphoglycerate mutase n=1 Tax=Acrobeloides nanus TaxID=290746 RepID=A0A914DMA4_9BILA